MKENNTTANRSHFEVYAVRNMWTIVGMLVLVIYNVIYILPFALHVFRKVLLMFPKSCRMYPATVPYV